MQQTPASQFGPPPASHSRGNDQEACRCGIVGATLSRKISQQPWASITQLDHDKIMGPGWLPDLGSGVFVQGQGTKNGVREGLRFGAEGIVDRLFVGTGRRQRQGRCFGRPPLQACGCPTRFRAAVKHVLRLIAARLETVGIVFLRRIQFNRAKAP